MKKYNIMLIMADQLTPYMMSCYGNKEVISPHLEQLAQQSICYENAYTSNPLCTPARASLMTGKYTSSMHCYDNASAFSCEEPTLAHYLTNAGYETILSGKMHFIGADQLHGFSRRLTTDVYPSGFCWLPHYVDEEKHILQSEAWGNAIHYNAKTAHPQEWNEGLLFDEETHMRAREYLYTEGKNTKEPFFLCVSYHHPHDPFQPPYKYWNLYEGADITLPDIESARLEGDTTLDKWLNTGFHRTDVFPVKGRGNLYAVRRAYSALVTYIDDKVGELIRDLKETGLYENTIIIFTSDHGDMLGEMGMVQKRCFYEWSSRIPLLIHYPDNRHERVEEPVSIVDLAPTIVDLAGEGAMEGAEGISLAGKKPEEGRPVFCESHGEAILWPCYMVRRGEFKYTYIHQKETQLFCLKDDPGEKDNLSGRPEYAELEKELKGLILERFHPEEVLHYMDTAIRKKKIVKQAMARTKTAWDYMPAVDESKRFSRK